MYSQWLKIISLTLSIPFLFLLKDSFAYPIDTSKLGFNGIGCPMGSDLKVIYNSTLNTLEFEPVMMAVTTNSEKVLERSNCGLSLPLVAVKKKRLIIKQIVLNGELSLNDKENSTISFDPFMVGMANPRPSYRQVFNGLQDGSFHIAKSINYKGPCGKSTNLRLNFSATNRGDGNSEGSFTKMSKVLLYLAEEKCKK